MNYKSVMKTKTENLNFQRNFHFQKRILLSILGIQDEKQSICCLLENYLMEF